MTVASPPDPGPAELSLRNRDLRAAWAAFNESNSPFS
jgi:hypothetical protein